MAAFLGLHNIIGALFSKGKQFDVTDIRLALKMATATLGYTLRGCPID
jgi:hypothetical protein